MALYTELPTKQLAIDPLYQRTIGVGSRKRIAVMAAGWDPALVGALEVSHRANGSYVIIDGQHRFLAAIEAGVTMLPCLVHEGLSTFEEARRFEELNTGRVRPGTADIFRAKLVAGDAHALAITTTLTKLGLKLSLTHSYALDTLQSVGILEHIERTMGADGLEDALSILMEAWPSDIDRWHNYLVGGVAGFIFLYRQHPDYDRKRLITGLSQHAPRSIINRVNAYGVASMGTGERSGGVGRLIRPAGRVAILDVYNYRLRKNLLPELSGSDVFTLARGGNPWAK